MFVSSPQQCSVDNGIICFLHADIDLAVYTSYAQSELINPQLFIVSFTAFQWICLLRLVEM